MLQLDNGTKQKITTMQSENKLLKIPFTTFATIIGLLTTISGLLIIIAWQNDITFLKTFGFGKIPIKANLGACFVLSGLSLLLLQSSRPLARILTRIFSITIIIISLLTILEIIFSVNFGIDEILFRKLFLSGTIIVPTRMALNAAISSVLTGTVLLFLSLKNIRFTFFIEFCFVLIFSISFLGLVGFISGLAAFSKSTGYTNMAVIATLLFLLMCLGLFFTFFSKVPFKISIDQAFFAGLVFIVSVILFITQLSNSGLRFAHVANEKEDKTQIVKNYLNRLLDDVLDIEIGVRGYLIINNEDYLLPIKTTRADLPVSIHELSILFHDNVIQKARIDTLNQLIMEGIGHAELLKSVINSEGGNAGKALFLTGKGKILTEKIRDLIYKIKTEENQILKTTNDTETSDFVVAQKIVFINVIIQMILLIVIFFVIRGNINQRRKALKEIRQLNEELEDMVQQRTAKFQESEKKYRDIIETSLVGVYSTSLLGEILFFNNALVQMMEADSIKELISSSTIVLYKNPDDRKHLLQLLQNNGIVNNFETELITRKGNSRIVILSAKLDGNIITGMMLDITDRKQVEEVLSNERTLLRTLLDLLPSFVFVKDYKMRFLVANVACARYMGASSPQELIGKTDAEFYPSEAAADFMSDELRVMEGIPVVNKEEGRVLSNGTRQIILTNKVPLRDNDGNIIGIVGASRDITQQKKAEQELIIANKELVFQNKEKEKRAAELVIANKELAFQNEEKVKRADELEIKVEERTKQLTETNKKLFEAKSEAEQANLAKSEFLANMSHEIRTPMNAVLGYTELLSSLLVDQTQKDYINSIKSSGRSLLTLINDILDLSKIEAGKLEIEYDFIDTYSFFSEFEKIFSLKVSEKGLKFILDITSGTPAGIYIDEARVRQIVFNLIGNAIKFTSEGKIILKVYTENPQIVNYSKEKTEELIDLIIEVKDTGIGISKELQEAIFEPFVQERDYKHYGGTGLGLAITRRLTVLMNGTINLQSELGKGSTFTVRIPEITYQRDFSGTNIDIQIDPAEIIFEEAIILIADDVEHNRSYLRDALRNTKLKVFEAEDGIAGYKLAKEIVPDLIIADIRMPKMDGFQLLNKIKTDKKLKHIPVIAYSASVLKAQKERIHNSEFAGLLIKPVKVTELYLELMNILPYKSTRVTEHDKPLSEVDLIGEITDLPGLIQSLETSFYATWKTFAVTQSIKEIREFGKNLSQLGLDHNSSLITGYGKDLINAADSFNIEAILKLIRKYTGIIENLKDSTKNISND